jgi:hypothetical protein
MPAHLTNITNWKITIFYGKTHYKCPFTIAMLNYQRVWCGKIRKGTTTSWDSKSDSTWHKAPTKRSWLATWGIQCFCNIRIPIEAPQWDPERFDFIPIINIENSLFHYSHHFWSWSSWKISETFAIIRGNVAIDRFLATSPSGYPRRLTDMTETSIHEGTGVSFEAHMNQSGRNP